jgi:hypothetical protein
MRPMFSPLLWHDAFAVHGETHGISGFGTKEPRHRTAQRVCLKRPCGDVRVPPDSHANDLSPSSTLVRFAYRSFMEYPVR